MMILQKTVQIGFSPSKPTASMGTNVDMHTYRWYIVPSSTTRNYKNIFNRKGFQYNLLCYGKI